MLGLDSWACLCANVSVYNAISPPTWVYGIEAEPEDYCTEVHCTVAGC